MAKTMTASVTPMTDGQIENVVAKVRDALRKHRDQLESAAVQRVNGIDKLGEMLIAPFRVRVEAEMEIIVRPFKVDRTKTPEELYVAMGRVEWYKDANVLRAMPNAGPAEGELVLFPLKRDTPVADVLAAYELRNLEPDPTALMQVMAEEPELADDRRIGCQWDASGSYVCVYRDGGERGVGVGRGGGGWSGDIWLAGRCKVSPQV